MRLRRKLIKYTAGFLVFLLLLLVLAFFLIRHPKVQTWLVNKVVTNLTASLQTKAEVDRVNVRFFRSVVLKGVYIEDQNRDTLIYAGRLDARIGLFSLFGKKLYLDKVTLDDAFVNLNHQGPGNTLNIAFLGDAFQADTTKTTTSARPWIFDIDKISLTRSRLVYSDQGNGFEIRFREGELAADFSELDVAEQSFTLSSLVLERADFFYNDLKAKPTPGMVDFGNLKINIPVIEIRDLNFNKGRIEAAIKEVKARDHSGFSIENLEAAFVLDENVIEAGNLVLKTQHSTVNSSAGLSFEKLSDLNDLIVNEVGINATFSDTRIGSDDLDLLLPAQIKKEIFNTRINQDILLNGRVQGSFSSLRLNDLSITAGQFVDLRADGLIRPSGTPEKMIIDLNVSKLHTSSKKLNALFPILQLPPELQHFGKFRIKARVRGPLNDLSFTNLEVITATKASLYASGKIKGLPNTEKLKLDFDIRELQIMPSDLSPFFQDSLPAQIKTFGQITYAGVFESTLYDFGADGRLSTALGSADADLLLKFNSDYSSAAYEGALALDSFDLEPLLPVGTGLGKATFAVNGKGLGLTGDDLSANFNLEISDLEFNNYPYRNITVEGEIKNKIFEGKAGINDPNARLDFAGSVSTGGTMAYDFSMKIDTLSPEKLNLFSQDFGIRTNAEINLSGNHLDDISGYIRFEGLEMNNDSLRFETDSLEIVAEQSRASQKEIRVTSSFMKARLNGDYQLSGIPQTVIDFLDEYFPVSEVADSLLMTSLPEKPVISDQQYDLNLEIYSPNPFSIALLPGLNKLDTVFLNAKFDKSSNKLRARGEIKSLDFDGTLLKRGTISATANGRKIDNDIRLYELQSGPIMIAETQVNSTFRNDTIRFNLKTDDEDKVTRFEAKGLLTAENNYIKLHLSDDLFLDVGNWATNRENAILFRPGWVVVKDLTLSDKTSILSVNSATKEPESVVPPVEFSFDQFDLDPLNAFLKIQNADLKGYVNGSFTLNDFLSNLHYTADLTVDSLGLEDYYVGQLDVNASQAPNSPVIDIDVRLEGQINELRSAGNYNTETREFDLQTTFPALELRTIDPFLTELVSDSKGYLSGDIKLRGQPEAPEINGKIGLHNLSTMVDMINTRIRITDNQVSLNSNEIALGSIDILDESDRRAILSGNIRHRRFSDIRLDLRLRTDEFQFLNTDASNNDLFYGNLFLKADLTLTGRPEEPDLDISARTLPGSEFTIVPFLQSDLIQEADYVIFSNPEKYREEKNGEPIYKIRQPYPFNLSLLLELTQDAELRFIVDPQTGDQLTCRGNANLSVEMDPTGEMDVFGTYVIESGAYDFSYAQIIKRQFEIREGSSAVFNGNPLDVRFYVTAAYIAKATTYELIKNEATLNNEEVSDAKRRTDVEVLLYLEGNLNDPLITFDIQVPSAQESSVISAVNRKLAILRSTPDELNQQVFALLLFNSFLLTDNSNVLTSAGESAALSSVSRLFSNQLNKLTERYVKGVELSLDLDAYKSEYYGGGTVTELKLGISKELFNDRLRLQAGGNIDLSSGSEASGFSNIVGDFLLEYELTEAGNYILKVFRRSNFDILNDANTVKNGVSVFIKKSFDKRSRKKKNKD